MQGWMATVWSRALSGTMIWFEPGGVLVVFCLSWAWLHGGTTMVSGACCFGMTTVRVPGACRAVVTGSIGWAADFFEPPQPLAVAAIDATAARNQRARLPITACLSRRR